MDAITEPTLRALLQAGAVQRVQAVADGRSWYVVIRVGMEEQVVASQRSYRRTWKSLDTLVAWLQDLGVARWDVDASHRSAQEAAS